MQYTNFFKAIPLSFFSAQFYREVSQCWRSRSFLYLLIVLLFCWFFIAFSQTSLLNRVISDEATNVIQQMPTLHFQHGVVSVKQRGPVMIKWANSQDPFIMINMLGKSEDLKNSDANFLIAKKNVLMKISADQISSYAYPKKASGIITPKKMMEFFQLIKKKMLIFIYIAMYIFGVFISYLYHLGLALLYGLIGLLFCFLLKRKLSYSTLFNLAIVVMTPAILLDTVLTFLKWRFTGVCWIFIAISLVYLFCVIKAIAPKKEQAVTN